MGQENVRSVDFSNEVHVPKDVLSEQRKKAQRIESLLELQDSSLEITVLGALHTGIIGDDIKESIRSADILTVELPSIALLAGDSENLRAENLFWSDIVNYVRSLKIPLLGVNNNRSAVNGIRMLEDRKRSDQKPFKAGPHIVVSTRSKPENSQINDFLKKLPFGDEKPSLVTVVGDQQIRNLLEPFNNGQLPLQASTDTRPQVFITQLQDLEENMRVLFVTGNFASSHEMWLANSETIAGHVTDKFPVSYDLVQAGLDHLLRLRVDKTQVDGMEDGVLSALKQGTGGKNKIRLLHVGGAAHNLNLVPILKDIFSQSTRVFVSEQYESRMFPVATDALTFFAQYVPIKDGLSTTAFYHDQALFDVNKTTSLLKRAIDTASEKLGHFFAVRQITRLYRNIVPQSDSAEFDIFTLISLLEFPSDGILPQIDENFIPKLASHIVKLNPEKKDAIEDIMKKHHARQQNFPMATTIA